MARFSPAKAGIDPAAPNIYNLLDKIPGLSFILTILLILGVGGFDSLNYAFTTVSTGGFSPHGLGLGYYRSIGHPNALPIEIATIVFMALGGLVSLSDRRLRYAVPKAAKASLGGLSPEPAE